ncbi:MAG: hypothetical protein EHM58_00550 [Ignavibacteriae bacterium]|nr:MAG: hypothetical protein EHM58_00550 [Ignavibacteriota bacterium]
MQSINVNTGSFDIMNFIFSLILMIVFLSFFMEGIRFFFTSIQEMVQPTSKVNDTVYVMSLKIPGWIEKIFLALAIIASIIIVRGMLDLDVKFNLTAQGYRAMFEMGIAMGFLSLGYTLAGPLIARNLTLKILKKYKFSDIEVITGEEYLALGKNK